MTRWLTILAVAVPLAACTPVPAKDDSRARCGLLEGPDCRRSVPGDYPSPETEIGKVAKQCARPRHCGPLGYIDCGSAMDGPAYFYERRSGKIIGYCGGYCMMNSEKCAKTCPPPEWTCQS